MQINIAMLVVVNIMCPLQLNGFTANYVTWFKAFLDGFDIISFGSYRVEGKCVTVVAGHFGQDL